MLVRACLCASSWLCKSYLTHKGQIFPSTTKSRTFSAPDILENSFPKKCTQLHSGPSVEGGGESLPCAQCSPEKSLPFAMPLWWVVSSKHLSSDRTCAFTTHTYPMSKLRCVFGPQRFVTSVFFWTQMMKVISCIYIINVNTVSPEYYFT